MLGELTEKLRRQENLSQSESEHALEQILSGTPDEEISGFLIALAEKGETAEEITGFARVMRRNAVPVESTHEVLVDTAGTGGGRSTFNVSTTAAFVIAGAGAAVAKHGNRAITSNCGSADVLTELGLILDRPVDCSSEALEKLGICFLFAPHHHPAMKRVAYIRTQLRRRTIFNMLGPLTNPASAPYQLIGVYSPELTIKIAEAAHSLGSKKVWVVHSNDGLDEVSVCSETQVAEASEEGVKSFEFKPLKKNLGLPEGGSPSQNAALIQAILDGSVSGPARDIVILNAAVALHIATGESLTGSIQKAEESISKGAAFEKLKSVISFYRDWK